MRLRCCLVQSETDCAISLVISHLVADGGDGKYLLRKLVEAYNLLNTSGTCKDLSLKNGNRAAEQVYENLSREEFFSLLKSPFGSVKSTLPLPSPTAGTPRILTRTISAETMVAARARAKESCHATVNDLLLTALYHAYAAMPSIQSASPMSIVSMMDLRQFCEGGDSPGLANLSGTLPTLLPNGIQQDFSSTLRTLSTQTAQAKLNPLSGLVGLPLLHAAVRHLPMGILLAASRMVYKNMALGLTNLGNMGAESLSMGNLRPDALFFGGPRKKKPSVQISAISTDETCALSIIGDYTQEDEAVLQSLLDHMVKQITDYIIA